jgi:hypothetical protein
MRPASQSEFETPVYGGNVIKFVPAWIESAIVAELSEIVCNVRIVVADVVVVVDDDVIVVDGGCVDVVAKFVRVWIESVIVSESTELDCHVKIVHFVVVVVDVGFVVVADDDVVVDDVVVQFVRALIESVIVAESLEMDCHVRIVLGVIDVVVGFVVVVVVVVVVVDVVVVEFISSLIESAIVAESSELDCHVRVFLVVHVDVVVDVVDGDVM